mgnify:CR=1 FL=1
MAKNHLLNFLFLSKIKKTTSAISVAKIEVLEYVKIRFGTSKIIAKIYGILALVSSALLNLKQRRHPIIAKERYIPYS